MLQLLFLVSTAHVAPDFGGVNGMVRPDSEYITTVCVLLSCSVMSDFLQPHGL